MHLVLLVHGMDKWIEEFKELLSKRDYWIRTGLPKKHPSLPLVREFRIIDVALNKENVPELLKDLNHQRFRDYERKVKPKLFREMLLKILNLKTVKVPKELGTIIGIDSLRILPIGTLEDPWSEDGTEMI